MRRLVHFGRRRSMIFRRLRNLFWRLISPLPDRPYLFLKYATIFGRFPNFKEPTRHSELQQLRKMTDRNPLYTIVVDKARVKDFYKERIGEERVIPTYWEGTDLATVDWSQIPLPAIVKPTHASAVGFFLNSHDDITQLMSLRPEKKWLALDHARFNREWAYQNVPRKIIIEKRIGDASEVLTDYRFYCFSGEVVQIIVRKFYEDRMHEAAFAVDWQPLDAKTKWYPKLPEALSKPENFQEMLEVVAKIGSDIPFARIDLYNTREGIFAGEVTLYPSGGFEPYVPDSRDIELAAYWQR